MNLRAASPADAGTMAQLHAAAFDHPWSGGALRELIAAPGVVTLAVGAAADDLAGFIMIRTVLDEAEVLTLAVAPAHRRRGLGRVLVETGVSTAQAAGAQVLWLEVAADNAAAQALYAAAGFVQAAVRRRYYARPGGPPVDALILRRTLDAAA